MFTRGLGQPAVQASQSHKNLSGADLQRTWKTSRMFTPTEPGFLTFEEARLINNKCSQQDQEDTFIVMIECRHLLPKCVKNIFTE